MKKVLLHPLITEKSSGLQANVNQYVFVVNSESNKTEIRKAVEALKKNIEVVSVKTTVVRGKVKRAGNRLHKLPNWKKAIVRLKTGQTLDVAEAV